MTATIGASPVTVMLNGTAYQFYPLTDGDWEELDLWAGSRVLMLAQQSISSSTPKWLRDEILAAASKASVNIEWRGTSGTNAGETQMAWRALRKVLALNDLSQLLRNPSNSSEVLRAYLALNSWPDDVKADTSRPT